MSWNYLQHIKHKEVDLALLLRHEFIKTDKSDLFERILILLKDVHSPDPQFIFDETKRWYKVMNIKRN